MAPKNTVDGTIQDAIDEVLQLLGLSGMGAAVEADILKGRRTVVPTLHRWTVALCLGEHFEQGRHFVEAKMASQMDDAKLRLIIETLSGDIKCPTHDALNVLAYTTLEYLQYPRLPQITLGQDQDARELFLAFVFLLGRQKWFHRTDKVSVEFLEFRKCLVNSINDGIDMLNITQELEKPGSEDIITYLLKRSEKTHQCHTDVINDSNPTSTGIPVPPTPISSIKMISSIKGLPVVHFLKVSETNRPKSKSRKGTMTQGKPETAQPASTTAMPTKTPATVKSRAVGLSKPGPLSKKTTPVHPLARKDDHVVNKCKSNTDVSDIFTDLETVVRGVLSDFEAKAQLLCRSKNAETFDSELLRIIIGQNDQQVLFNNLMDNNEMSDISPDLNASNARSTRLSVGRTKVFENKDEVVDKDNMTDELNNLCDEIRHLSHTIIQTQSRLKRLSQDVEHGDAERLKHFSRISENLKMYDRSMNNKDDNDAGEDQHSFINDRYSMPSPAEWLLISQPESFDRHLALLKIIAKSLDNETKRSSMFEAAITILDHIKPEQSNKRASSTRASARAGALQLVTIPHEVRETVNAIKSFMVDGIPSENFRHDQSEGAPDVQGATDFLRQINSSFANYRASTVASEKGKKGSFLNYLTAALKERCTEGRVDIDAYADTRETVDKMCHLFGDSAKYDPRIQFTSLQKWIQVIDDANGPHQVNTSSATKVYNTHGNESLERQEARDFEALQKLVNHGSMFIRDYQALEADINADLRRDYILDFKHYFNLARNEYITNENNDDENLEPTIVKFGKLLKQHNSHITQSQMKDLKEAMEIFERIEKCLPSITLIE